MGNELIIRELNTIDIYSLEEKEVIALAKKITLKIKIKPLEEAVTKACLDLSGVGSPKFGADITTIALDNQSRLELIWKLIHDIDTFKRDVANLKKQKDLYEDNYEYVFNFLENTQSLIKTVIQYGSFKQNEFKEEYLLGG